MKTASSTSSGVAESVVRILGDASAADAARAAIEAADPSTLPLRSEVALAPPVTPGTIFAIGYNYRGHTAADPDAVVADPAHPDVFVKTANALRGADEAVVLPRQSQDVDYEGEIALVIGLQRDFVSATADDLEGDVARVVEHFGRIDILV